MGADGAVGAVGFAGDADAAAVEDHGVAELGPVLFGDELHQVDFELDRVGLARQAHQP